jgi:hypothetical protein
VGFLHKKRYFLVLDDMWNEEAGEWEDLRSLLCSGGNGSVVIVTTRGLNVASVVKTLDPYEVGELPQEECMEVFFRHAFKGEEKKGCQVVKNWTVNCGEMLWCPFSCKDIGLPVVK